MLQVYQAGLLVHRFAGDIAELGIIRAGSFMKVKVALNPRVHLVRHKSVEVTI